MADVLVRDKYRAQNWAMVIQECNGSGLSNREFCRHIISQIHMAELAVTDIIPIGYGCLMPDENFIQGLEFLFQLQATTPVPSIALGLE